MEESLKPLPTSLEMQAFAKQFTKDQWDYLCTNPDFIKNIVDDISLAQSIAEKFYPKLKK